MRPRGLIAKGIVISKRHRPVLLSCEPRHNTDHYHAIAEPKAWHPAKCLRPFWSHLMMNRFSAIVLFVVAASFSAAGDPDTRVYELRVYSAAPGKLDNLQARFREHTVKLFEKHGMTNVGYWVPIENPERQLIYLLAFPSAEAREKSWKEFSDDPVWKRVRQETELNGKIVNKVETVQLAATDYSPELKIDGKGRRVFELRTYTAAPDQLGALNARFRDHTVKLFTKHGMTNIGYWTPIKGQKGEKDTLIYLLAHKSVDAAKASFDTFRQDSDWIAARKASEDKAGGSLTVKDGVKSQFLKPTDYSPMK
jgi:NIPSNAP